MEIQAELRTETLILDSLSENYTLVHARTSRPSRRSPFTELPVERENRLVRVFLCSNERERFVNQHAQRQPKSTGHEMNVENEEGK